MQEFSIPAGAHFLPAWFHSASATAPTLVVCHGFCGSPAGGSSLELAACLLDRNINTLRFSFTPYCCLSQQVAEIRAVLDFRRTNLSGPVALMGRSMGAAASLASAAGSDIAGLCLMACPADLPTTFSGMLGDGYTRLENGESLNILYEGQSICLTSEFIEDLKGSNLIAAAAGLRQLSLLVVHGLDDTIVPPDQGRRLYAAAACPKELLLLSGVSHSFVGQANQFVSQVAHWLQHQVFGAPAHFSREKV